jgi:hypothetical protein
MIGTNRDLIAMREILDHEILRLQLLALTPPAPSWVRQRLALLARQRVSLCAALTNRRTEAANKVVVFSRWVSGDGALPASVEPFRLRAPSDAA